MSIRFAVIGAGWRTEFYLRIAQQLPHVFQCTSVLARSQEKADRLSRDFGVRCVNSLEDVLEDKPDFIVTSVSWTANAGFCIDIAKHGIPVLSETPPAPNIESMVELWHALPKGAKVDVAEQYFLHPSDQARLKVIELGKIGTPAYAHIAACHGYHGTSLIRKYLGLTFEPCQIQATKTKSAIIKSPDRNGPPSENTQIESAQTLAWLSFENGKFGMFEFNSEQYFSWIRSSRFLVRGEKGEIADRELRTLSDHQTPSLVPISRRDAGADMNLEGMGHLGYTLGETWVYKNPYSAGRLTDDEIAIAHMMEAVGLGRRIYAVEHAMQDHYLGILIDQAAASGEKLQAPRMPWAH